MKKANKAISIQAVLLSFAKRFIVETSFLLLLFILPHTAVFAQQNQESLKYSFGEKLFQF